MAWELDTGYRDHKHRYRAGFGRKVRISRDMMCNFVAELPKVWSKGNLIWQLMRGNLSIKTVRHAGQGKKKSSFLF